MTVKEKAEYFYKMAIESATASNLEQVNAFKEQLKKQEEVEMAQIDKSVARNKKYEMEQILRKKNSTLAVKEIERKHEYSDLVAQLKDELFDEVEKEVKAFCQSEQYPEFLLKQIQVALTQMKGEACVVYVTSQDLAIVKTQKFPENVRVLVSENEFWGGARIESEKNKMVYDMTFASNFLESKLAFQLQ